MHPPLQAGTRSARESAISRVRPHRRRESAGCEGTGDWDKPSGRSNRASGAWCKEEGATVVETNIHTATDSCLLGDGARGLMRTRRLPRSKKNEYVTACAALDRKGPSPLRFRTNHARGRHTARMSAHGPIQRANSFRSIRLFLNVKVSRFSFDLMRRTGARASKSSFHFGGGTACLLCCVCCSAACRAIIRLRTSACWSGASTLKISLFSRLCNRSSVTSFWP